MNKQFKIEHSIYALGAFIAIVGVLFLIARSDAVLKFQYFNKPIEQAVVEQEVEASHKIPSYLLLTGADQSNLQEALIKRLELMGKEVEVRSITSIETKEDLEGYISVIIATEQIELLNETDLILRFVEDGGSLFFAVRPAPGPALSTLYQSLGLVETGSFIETTGIELEQPFFNEAGETDFASDNIINSSLTVRLSGDAELFASSSTGIPLLWKAFYGEGTFVVFNGTMFSEMTDQALFVKGIQQLTEHVIMPMINARITELSGFPFLVPTGRDLSPAYTNRDYYRTLVWPELQRIESKYDLNYTASYKAIDDTGSLNLETSPELEDLRLYGRELLRMGGEIALHVSSASNQERSVQQVQSALPDYSLHAGVSLSLEMGDRLSNEMSTMLAPVKYIEEVEETIVLPAIAEGFELKASEKWKLFNELFVSGLYTHSVDASSFIEAQNAEEQMTVFADFQQSMYEQVPWIRSLTLSKAGEAAFPYLNSDLYETQKGNKLIFSATAMIENQPAYYYLSTKRTIAGTENCEVRQVGKDLYLVTANDLTFAITLGESK
ncbi:hypothetical protein KP77_34730 [Jeotgalibacillus alimentarius]|uniref:DUF2194 domain-containing protein n=1 Tax=Jeotgalibacillus alimentarius TaxID=135826 RepID=A0A0C2VFQ6_9BACL|nr:DUF2194 domain-containing protein [Jeotgalibacillus alimentarius]KIL42843.1 hypothetical protein KP77_34730 [Jeotgalibacillus alimentarius]